MKLAHFYRRVCILLQNLKLHLELYLVLKEALVFCVLHDDTVSARMDFFIFSS